MAARQTDPQFKFRIPPELKARLESSAESNARTLTAEIIHRLENSFPPALRVREGQQSLLDMIESIEHHAQELRKLVPPDSDLKITVKHRNPSKDRAK